MEGPNEIGSRRERYMVGRKAEEALPQDAQPLEPEALHGFFRDEDALEQLGVEVLDQVGSSDEPVYVVLMDDEGVEQLRTTFGEALIIEEDRPLDLVQPGTSRLDRYIVSRKTEDLPQGAEEPVDLEMFRLFFEGTRQSGTVEVLDQVGSPDEPVYVVLMDDEGVEQLRTTFGEMVVAERANPSIPQTELISEIAHDASLLPLGEEPTVVRITVRGEADDQPVPDADVYLIGQRFPILAKTNGSGWAELRMLGETTDTLRTLIVRPRENYWSRVIDRPDVKPGQENVVRVKSLSATFSGFPKQERYGWGEETMKLDRVPENRRRGQGVKIAVIDTGIHTAHEDLEARDGYDLKEGSANPEENWKQDSLGHGSHVTGVIAGLDDGGGVRGFAPDAEIHGFSIFPGGRTSWLINALHRCIDEEIDVVNLSLGDRQKSQLLHQKIRQARDSGVACIAAAGNSAGPVMYPAGFEEVFAVAAIGKLGTFPEDSDHARRIGQYRSDDGQYFTAGFTCFGDEVDACAPGVAIVSAVPENGWAAWDGTSMACPHVTGLAALVLSHRDDVPELQQRNSRRVDELFTILRESTDDLGLPQTYQGSGLPNALKALGDVEETETTENPWERLADLLEKALEVARAQVERESTLPGDDAATPEQMRREPPSGSLFLVDGEALAQERESKGLTLEELEARSGLSSERIRELEGGFQKARRSTLERLAEALETDTSALVIKEEHSRQL
jgi:subtilisin